MTAILPEVVSMFAVPCYVIPSIPENLDYFNP